jgi:DNA-binding transcriptional ArsR family regulator
MKELARVQVPLEVEIFPSTASEMLAALGAYAGPEKCETLEVGCAWFDEIRTRVSPELGQAMADFPTEGHAATMWSALRPAAVEARLGTAADLLEHLEGMEPDRLLLHLWACESIHGAPADLDEKILQAHAGDAAAQTWLLTQGPKLGMFWVNSLANRFALTSTEIKKRSLHVLQLWYRDVFASMEDELKAILERDAEAKRKLARKLSPEALFEVATNGIEYGAQPGFARVVLIPGYVMRPWSVGFPHGREHIVVYPVAEESVAASPEAAALNRIVKVSKVLSDETRVRALKKLSEGRFTLQELADDLGIRKSTMHHHLAALRAAGLLRTQQFSKAYTLRREAVGGIPELLQVYLDSGGDRTPPRRKR